MADVNLKFEKNTTQSDRKSINYSATKTVGNKTCTIFVNDRTKNGFGKDDSFFYDGDISLFSQKEIKDLIEQGVDGKKYDENNVAKSKISKINIQSDCKEMAVGKYYELGSVFSCANKGAEAEAKTDAEAKAKAEAEAAAKAKAEADAKAAEAAKAATPAATEKPAEAAKTEKTDPAPPAPPTPPTPPTEAPEQDYYNQYGPPQGGYEPPSLAATIGAPVLAGGAIGGILGMLFGGARGFFGGFLGGALGGLMNLFGGGMGGGYMGGGMMGGGYDDGTASLNGPLNWVFANGLNNMAAMMSQPIYVAPVQHRPATPASNLPELTDKNFDSTIKDSKTPVVVEFVMDGCKGCEKQGPVLDEISKDYSGKAQVYQIDAVKADAIKTKYNVTEAPTILVFKDGKEVGRLKRLQSKDKITAILDKNLQTEKK